MRHYWYGCRSGNWHGPLYWSVVGPLAAYVSCAVATTQRTDYGLVGLILLVYQNARWPIGFRPSLGAAPEHSTALLLLLLLQDSLQPLPLRLVLPRRPRVALRWGLIFDAPG